MSNLESAEAASFRHGVGTEDANASTRDERVATLIRVLKSVVKGKGGFHAANDSVIRI